MKTICFVSLGELFVTKGGVHRVTYCLMNELDKLGYRCLYLFYNMDMSAFYTDNIEDENHKLLPNQIEDYFDRQKIDIIIYQQAITSAAFPKMVSKFQQRHFKFISVFHNSPCIYEKTFTFSRILYNFRHQGGILNKISNLVRLVSYPLWKWRAIKNAGKMFAQSYDVSDKCIMLSANEYPILSHYLGHDVTKKCVTIHNPLTFNFIETEECLKHKEKKVLIVSRLNNFEKRLDRALKIWKRVELSGINDWHLLIVGWGLQEQMLHDLAQKLKLKNVHFEGRQPSEPYYHEASIFMMTSAVEGWGLTLTESMQSAVVPIVFNSYPALTDIITNGYDGFIIPDDNIEEYSKVLINLIHNKKLREHIAKNGLVSCQRFEISKIVNQWVDLIESL